jgi:VIT1/CCC1 family predicted Fe2+/Mn2+ transporter
MTTHPPSEHFEGKSVVDHLKEARERGAMASAEIHGTEMPGHLAAGADSSKEMAIGLLILWVILSHFVNFDRTWTYLLLFSAGWILWKTARSAILGYSRMERLHRLIEEERYEIEHHRAQEREELTEMYRAKGLTGKLLEEVIDVLMADDNRLLQVMLEEELGLTLHAYEHPLKQAFGALCGAIAGAALCLFGLWLLPAFGLPLFAAIVVAISSTISAKLERNSTWNAIIWNLGIAGVVTGCTHFLIPLIHIK